MTIVLPDTLGIEGRTIDGKYEVERPAGVGGFSIVYRARHRVLHHEVALKCFVGLSSLPRESRTVLIDAFMREGELMARLSSRIPEIAQARDVGEFTTASGQWVPYLVLEWLDGVSLDVLLDAARARRARGWSLDEAVGLLRAPYRALARVHEEGVAHRDIKPANLFVLGGRATSGAAIKLLDFGVAKVMQATAGDPSLTGVGGRSFTPEYGAPEQFDRGHGPTGPWTDVFAAALVLVEMLTGGQSALEGRDYGQLGFASQHPLRRPTPRTLGIEVSDAVEDVFRRALAVDAKDRFRDMGSMWTALEAAVVDRRETPRARTRPAETIVGLPSPPPPARDRSERTSLSAVRTSKEAAEESEHPTIVVTSEADPPRRGRHAVVAALALLSVGAGVWLVSGHDGMEPAGDAPQVAALPAELAAPTLVGPTDDAPPPPCDEGMVHVAGGKFWMGTDRDHPALAAARPPHQVQVGRYCLDLHEVTVAAYRECSSIGECKRASSESWWPRGDTAQAAWALERRAYDPLCNESRTDREDHPINCVTWAQAARFCAWGGKRLPTEAEWEFAARGSDGRVFPWGDDPPDQRRANACGQECTQWRRSSGLAETIPMFAADDGFAGTSPVGAFAQGATQWGPVDMVGNVFEWVADSFRPYAEGESEPGAGGAGRVIRGGAFNSFVAEFADPALRFGADPESRTPAIGFRCASDPATGVRPSRRRASTGLTPAI
jgi:formylglycine-generating enzyme required for sulfatase activity